MFHDPYFARCIWDLYDTTLSEDWSLLGPLTCACPNLRTFALRVPVYPEWQSCREEQNSESGSRPDPSVYSTVLSTASRSLRTLSFVLTVVQCLGRRRRRAKLIEGAYDLVGLEDVDKGWVRERFGRLEAVEVVVPESELRREMSGLEVLKDLLVRSLPGLHAAGILRIIRGS